MIFPARSDLRAASVSVSAPRAWPNRYDIAVFALIAAVLTLIVQAAQDMSLPLARLDVAPVTLDVANLPNYALRTTLRMFAAILASLLFTLGVGALAAKSRKAELVVMCGRHAGCKGFLMRCSALVGCRSCVRPSRCGTCDRWP